MGVEVAFGLFAVPAASAVQRLIAGVVEGSLPELISVWQFGSAHLAGYRTLIHLGSHLNLRRIVVSPFARSRSCGRACCVLLSSPRNFFRAALVSGERLMLSIFPLGLSQNLEAEGKIWVWGIDGLKILGCEGATICGGRTGLFPWPTTPVAASLNRMA
jgi:hypothetical protein